MPQNDQKMPKLLNDLAPRSWASYNVRMRRKKTNKGAERRWQERTIQLNRFLVKLREVELYCNQGKSISEVCRGFGITEQTYYAGEKSTAG